MKKILLFIDSLTGGGAQKQLVGLARLLNEKGYQVKVTTYRNIDFFEHELREIGIKNDVIAEDKNIISRFPAFIKYVKKYNPDVVISYLESPSIISCVCRAISGKYKLIVSERNTSQKFGLNEFIRFNLFRIADKVVPNAYSQEDFIAKQAPFLKSKTSTISNFVNLDVFSPKEDVHSRNKKQNILIAATIWEPKNTLNFIRAVKKLTDKTHDFHIKWYGSGENHCDGYLNECLDLISELSLTDYIELLPKTKDIIPEYQSADFFCLPSFYEGTPNVICEAIACGLPVVCSNVCDNPIYVKDGTNGYLFNPTDIDDMAEALYRMLKISDAEYESFRNNSRDLAERLLSEDTFINKYISIL